MNMLDIVIIAFIAFTIFRGYTLGAIKSLFHLMGYFVAVVVTYFYHIPVKNLLIETTPIDESISGFVADRLRDLGANSTTATVSTSDLNALEKLPLPDAFKENISDFLTSTVTSTTNNVTAAVTDILIGLIAVIGLFLIVLFAIKILSSLLDVISKLPVINSFNHGLGAIFGVIKAYLIICIVYLIGIAFLSLNTHPQVQSFIETSYLSHYFINYNIFLMWLQYMS